MTFPFFLKTFFITEFIRLFWEAEAGSFHYSKQKNPSMQNLQALWNFFKKNDKIPEIFLKYLSTSPSVLIIQLIFFIFWVLHLNMVNVIFAI